MIDKIKNLEKIARQLEPSKAKRREWNQAIQAYGDDFLDHFNKKTTFVVNETLGKGILDYPIEENPKDISVLLKAIKENIDTPNLNPASGGHFGYIPGGGLFTTALGDYLAAVTNRYAGIFFACPGSVRMENGLIRWMCKLVGYPKSALGNLTSGGSIANLMAITTARDKKRIKAKDIDKSVIYLTRQAHHCIQKALRIAGLQEAIIRYIPMDHRFKMRVEVLEKTLVADKTKGLRPFMIIGSAGTTDTGAIDPLEAIGRLAHKHDVWFHVDAAYGGFLILAKTIKPLFKGIELSDSLAIDPHKGLFIAYGLGALLIKDVKALYASNHHQANYMQDSFSANEEVSPADLSPELTKHFRGLRLWLSLQLFGTGPFSAALEEKVWLCRYFYEEVQKLGFEVGPYPELTIIIFRYIPKTGAANAFNQQIIEAIKQDGRIFLSSTTIDETFWIRFAVMSFRTHLEQVNLALKILKKLIDSL